MPAGKNATAHDAMEFPSKSLLSILKYDQPIFPPHIPAAAKDDRGQWHEGGIKAQR